MSRLDDRLAARSQQATDAAKAVASNGAGTPATATTPSEKTAEKPAEPPATPAKPPRPARPAQARMRAETPPEMDKYERAHWRTLLQTSARKLARDRERLDESEQGWAATVAAARAAGVPANVLLAAAADADVELPE